MMSDQIRDDDFLKGFFAAARAENPAPDAALMGRVLADAKRVQAGFGPARVPPPAPQGAIGCLIRAVGGWPVLAGMTAAAATGIWIGLSAPQSLDRLLARDLAGQGAPHFVDLMPSFNPFSIEG